MKILALRGENICSLQSPFEIDFTREPLASAGLFAISGPTGAGKSTLLDVLCLALYHTTPRLLSAPQRDVSVPDLEDEKLSVSDARNLLRKGAPAGYAEVDFCGTDKVAYRARWSVRRARGQARGKLQKIQVSLHALPERRLLSDSLAEVSKLVEMKVGLTFSEFTRSVLLAQNEFTSFLKAPENDKAAILEKLTGVDLFSRLGRRIYERSTQLEKQMGQFRSSVERVVLLSSEQRQEKRTELELLRARSTAQQDACDMLRDELQSVVDLQQLSQRSAQFAQDIEKTLAALEGLHAELKDAEHGVELLRNERLRYEQPLAEARVLDAQCVAQADVCRLAEKTSQQAEQAVQHADSEVARLKVEVDRLENKNSLLMHWNETHSQIRPWAEQWSLLSDALARAERSRREAERLRFEQGETQRQWLESQSVEKRLSQEVEKSRASIEILSQQARSVEQDMPSVSFVELERSRAQIEDDLRRRQTLFELKTAERVDQQELHELADQLTQNLKLQEQLNSEIEREQRALESLSEEYNRQQRMRESIELKISQSVSALRASLRSGSECPVCGSTEHPFVVQHIENPLRELLTEVQTTLGDIEHQQQSHRAQLERSKMSSAQVVVDLQTLEKRTDILKQQGENRLQQWQRISPDVSMADVVIENLDADVHQAKSQLEHVQAEVRRSAELQQKLNELNAGLKKADQYLHGQLAELQMHSKQAMILQERFKQQALAIAVATEDMDAELSRLETAAGRADWRSEWMADPAGVARQWATEVELWLEQQREVERLQSALLDLRPKIAVAQERASERQQAAVLSRSAFAQQRAVEQDLLERRRQLLDGRAVNDVERELEERLVKATQRLQVSERRLQELLSQKTTLEARQQELQAQYTRQSSDAQPRRARLAPMLAVLPVLTNNPQDTLSDPEVWSIESLSECLKQQQDLKAEVESQTLALRAELDADTRAQSEKAEIIRQMQECESEWNRWNRLNDLLGCATGNRFRKEAQRYTLAVLLAHANHHLESFAPRYRLVLQQEGLNILVEDLDAGGEQRSVYSLSGGESFLVSLALAMGLSSLSSEQVHVESLFIDEGFGSLDAELLRTALHALDALQSQGRKVGVISHVGEMAERIGVQIQVQPLGQGRSKIVSPTS